MNCPTCNTPQADAITTGTSLNMGYGRMLPIYWCSACHQKWCLNHINGYLNIPTGVLLSFNHHWVPLYTLLVTQESPL